MRKFLLTMQLPMGTPKPRDFSTEKKGCLQFWENHVCWSCSHFCSSILAWIFLLEYFSNVTICVAQIIQFWWVCLNPGPCVVPSLALCSLKLTSCQSKRPEIWRVNQHGWRVCLFRCYQKFSIVVLTAYFPCFFPKSQRNQDMFHYPRCSMFLWYDICMVYFSPHPGDIWGKWW